MTNIIVFTNENGGVTVCAPTGELSIQEVQAKDIPQGVVSFIVDAATLPLQDEDFFDAWEQNNGMVIVNLEKAKIITKKRLQQERIPLFAALDIEFQKALESGADISAIVAAKQRLRDITNVVDSCQQLQELRSLKVEQ
jgi:hypothetical protein